MENEQQPVIQTEELTQAGDKWYRPLIIVTPLSRFLALVLFVVLPFLGFWLGQQYAHKNSPVSNYQNQIIQRVDDLTPDSKKSLLVGEFPLITGDSSWGPCLEENQCWQRVEFINTGKLIVSQSTGTTTHTLSDDLLQEVIAIQQTLKNSSCDSSPVMDYWATYNVYGRNEPVEYPGCEQQLNRLQEIIDDTSREPALET